MKAKIEEKEIKDAKTEFPCLMKSTLTGRVMLMTSYGVGMSVSTGYVCKLHDGWTMDNFVPYNGSVTLSND